MLRRLLRIPLIARFCAHIPPAQFGRYLLVGTCNTVFGYSTFAVLTALLDPRIPHGYMVASALSSFINITVAFLGYKWFVFRTKGNYFREWCRCVAVYGSGIVIGLILLPITVWGVRHAFGLDHGAPYVAGAILTGVGVVYNFVGHRRFSFRGQAIESGERH